MLLPRPTVVFAASLTEAQARISEHENNFGVQFRRHKNPKNFGRSDWRSVLPKKKVSFSRESGGIHAVFFIRDVGVF